MSHSVDQSIGSKFGSWSNSLYTSRKPPLLGTVSTEEELLQKFEEKFKDDPGAFWYVAGSAGSESTFRANRAIFDHWKLIPRMLVQATNRSLQVELFGVKYSSPVILAPIGVQGILHPDAELASARAAEKVGVVFTMSTASSRSIELVAEANGNGHRWYQLYWPRTEAVTLSILKRAKEKGYKALILTLDTMLLGYRWHDLERSYLPFLHGIGTQVGTSDPAFMAKHNEQPTQEYYSWPYNAPVCDKAYLEGDAKIKRRVEISTDWIGEINSGTFRDWKDLEFLKRNWDGPIILKGIQSREDAEKAFQAGVDGIVVSNHGGRQVDGAVASLRALESIMKSEIIKTAQSEGKFTVLFDSGIRTGSDIIKAIALGANAILLGRPYVYGLALGGESGVESVIRNILCELDITLGLIGQKSIKDIHGKADDSTIRPVWMLYMEAGGKDGFVGQLFKLRRLDGKTEATRTTFKQGVSRHQKVVLDIDFTGCLRGYTEITILPTHKDLRTIYLHCRQCDIESVTVASYPAEFIHCDPVVNLNVSDPSDFHTYPEVKRRYYSALAEGDEGELAIAIPPEVLIKHSGNAVAGRIRSEAATPEPMTPGNRPSTPSVPEFLSIHVVIEYTLRQPVDGVQFVLPSETYPQRVPHVYTTPSGPDAARCWVPCVDSLWEKCTWEFEFVVPRVLQQESDDITEIPMDDDEVPDGLEHPVVVVCSGDFSEQIAHPHNSSKTLFLFSQSVATSVQQIAFAAGAFHVYQLPANEGEDSASQTPMHAFSPIGYEKSLASSVSFLRSAMNFYSTEFGSYPFGSYKTVFVDELPVQRFDTATLSLVHLDVLHGEDAIDQIFETRHMLSHGLACQWVGINIYQKTWSDTWLINGLGLYITGLFIRKLMGNNDYRFKLKKDMERVAEKDVGTMPPICQPGVLEPPEPAFLPFINIKAPLVLHILDRRLAKSGTSLGLSRILPKIFLSAISGELPGNAVSTHTFLRMCRKVSGVDPRSFAEQWIYGSGCPRFGFNAQFNRKKMVVEITMRQESPAYRANEGDPIKLALLKPVQVFEGPMTVRIHEADGTPYEHVLDIRSSFKRYEVPFNTKYKRVRRNTKRFIARQQAAIAAAQGDSEAKEAIGMIDMGFGLDVWEQEAERENWKVADWTEEDEQVMAGATYEWIRMDADFEWICFLHFDQPDFMWVSQLTRDRDVVAQLEAVYALSRQPSAIVSSTLTKTVLVTNYYYRIRIEAALALVTCAIHRLDFLGLFHLFKIFSRYCYDATDKNQDLFVRTYVPRPNDFSDFSEYFVRKSVITGISQVRLNNGKSPPIVRQLLIDQLRHNDNTTNAFSDALYVSTIISALACACVSTVPPERGEFLPTESISDQNEEDRELLKAAYAEVERYRTMDRLVPSPHNVVTIAALEWNLILTLAGLIPPDPKLYLSFTREGNENQVRIAAFDGLMLLNDWYSPRVISYLLTVVARDSSRVVRRHVARCMSESLAILFHIGDIKHTSKDDPLLIEEDGNVADTIKESKKNEADALVKALRKNKDIGRNDVLRQEIMHILLSKEIDHEVRLSLLKLADLVFKGAEESPPKVTIHIPRAPVIENTPAAVAPGLKKRLKISVPGKAGTPTPGIPGGKIKLQTLPQLDTAASPSPARNTSVRPLPPSQPAQPKVDQQKKEVAFATPKIKPNFKAPPPKKSKPLHPAQANGMSVNDLRASRSALKKLLANKHSRIFAQPVDPVRDNAPNYFAIIKNAMDLSTINAKLEGGLYADRFAFESDFKLMINNAKTYNAAGTWAFNEALELDSFFQKQWERINKTLEEVAHKAAPAPAPPQPSPPKRQVPARGTGPKSKPTSQPNIEEDIDAMILQEISETPPPPPPVIQPLPRPTIKLRMNGTANGASSSASGSTPSKPLPKTLKAKVPSSTPSVPKLPPPKPPPPPPRLADEDDAAKELLEEVLAIEEERKLEKRMAFVSSSGSSTPKKDREKVSEDLSRKEKERPKDREKHKEKDAKTTASPQAPVLPKLIVKKPTNGHGATPPSIKGKGKEREIVPRSSGPSRQQSQGEIPSNGTPIIEKKCKEILKKLIALPQALLFRQPVDAELLGCPTYYDEIKEPMDFATMGKKLDKHQYTTMEQFAKDMFLVFNNCRQFNPAGTEPVQHAEVLEKAFRKEWSKAIEKTEKVEKVEKKIDVNDKKMLQAMLSKLRGEECAYFFLEAVDPIKLQIPHYFDVIPRKDARDLKLIREKLDADKYDSVAAVEADIELMVKNAITFNGADSFVGVAAIALAERFKELLKGKGATKKRKEKEITGNGAAASGGGLPKKARLV